MLVSAGGDRVARSPLHCGHEPAQLPLSFPPGIPFFPFPACGNCQKCQSIRVLAQHFTPNAGERRILRKNKDIRAELNSLFATTDHVELYNLYHRFMNEHRGWPLQQTTLESYRLEFLSGARNSGRQWLYFQEDKLVGVALMDEVPERPHKRPAG